MSLGLVQVANYIVPIITIPIVVRALGVEFFGKASYAQNIISYLTLIITYGFEYSATQDVAIYREDKSKLRIIFWTVIRFKILLLIITSLFLVILYFIFSKVQEDPLLYFYAVLVNVGIVLFPTWFFQGMEKIKNMALFNLAIKLLGAILIVLLINNPSDYRNYVIILSLSYVVVGIVSFFYVIKKYDLKIDSKNKELSTKVVSKGFPIFLNNLFITGYATIGITIIGIYLSDYYVGIYSGAFRITQAVIMLTTMPVSYSLFPVMSRKFNESKIDGWIFFRKSLTIIIVLSVLICLCIFFSSSFIVNVFLGDNFNDSISVLKAMSIIPSLVFIATILTVQGLYALQLQKYSPFVGFFSGLTGLGINLLCIPLWGVYGAVWAWIFAELVEILIVSYIILRHKKRMFF